MSKLRIINNNAADRATITASTTAGALVPANMKTDLKAQVWRSTSTSATITATWTTAEVVSGIVLPFCNLTTTATIRVRGYALVGDASPVYDTGANLACPDAPPGLWNWGSSPMGANAFAYAGGAYARAWPGSPTPVQKIVIDLVDVNNAAGYVEASRLVCGAYWEAATNPDYGISVTPVDTSKHFRNDAGDLMTDPGTLHSKMTFTLAKMAPADRTALWNILRGNGMARPLLISAFPFDGDTQLERMHQIYGKLTATPAMAMPFFRIATATVDIEEI